MALPMPCKSRIIGHQWKFEHNTNSVKKKKIRRSKCKSTVIFRLMGGGKWIQCVVRRKWNKKKKWVKEREKERKEIKVENVHKETWHFAG